MDKLYIIAYYNGRADCIRYATTHRDISAFDGVFLNDTFDPKSEARLRKMLYEVGFDWNKALDKFPEATLMHCKQRGRVIVTGEL